MKKNSSICILEKSGMEHRLSIYLSAESNRVYLHILGFPHRVISNNTKHSTRKCKVFRHGAGYGQNTYQPDRSHNFVMDIMGTGKVYACKVKPILT